MSDFLRLRGNSAPSAAESNAKKEELMAGVRRELANANAQTLMNNATEKCFKACVTKPGTSLSNSEQTCLARCLDRFLEAYTVTRRAYFARLAKERAESQAKQPDS